MSIPPPALPDARPDRAVIAWLLDSDPALRWQVRRDLMGASDADVAADRSRIATEGLGARLLALQAADGRWGGAAWNRGWNSTMHALMLLREFGLDPAAEPARRALTLVRERVTWHIPARCRSSSAKPKARRAAGIPCAHCGCSPGPRHTRGGILNSHARTIVCCLSIMFSRLRPWHPLLFGLGAIALLLAACRTPAPAVPPSATPVATARIDGAEDISDRLDAVIRRREIPGMVAVVLRGDRIIAAGAAGVRRQGSPVRVTLDDQFAIASAAKAMSATVIARLVDQGKLRWQTPIEELFPSAPKIDPAWRGITVRQLLEHQAGLKDHLLLFARTALWSDGEAPAQRRAYALEILARPPDSEPGTRFLYNNTDYLILGAAAEALTGRSWSELMNDEVFRPLGIASGGFGPPGTAGQLDQPWGHGGRRPFGLPLLGGDTAFDPGSAHADFPLAAAPSGFVHLTIRDWTRFAAVHLRGDAANPQREIRLLDAETFDALHFPGKADAPYAGGWFTGTRVWAKGRRPEDRGRVLFHAGNNGRWTSVAWLAPEIDFAILVACNRGGMAAGVDEVASLLVGAFAAPKDAPADESSTRNWSAWLDKMPIEPPRIHVKGEAYLAGGGAARLVRANSPASDSSVLRLDLVITGSAPPPAPGTWAEARYDERPARAEYTEVEIRMRGRLVQRLKVEVVE